MDELLWVVSISVMGVWMIGREDRWEDIWEDICMNERIKRLSHIWNTSSYMTVGACYTLTRET